MNQCSDGGIYYCYYAESILLRSKPHYVDVSASSSKVIHVANKEYIL